MIMCTYSSIRSDFEATEVPNTSGGSPSFVTALLTKERFKNLRPIYGSKTVNALICNNTILKCSTMCDSKFMFLIELKIG